MTYGAMIRIMAARGLPEQALNILEEMQAANVKPTPLIFSSALKAVARSHANALRFHGGRSSKNKRRELITAHHGNMTRAIVIAADNARVDQDDSFVSALMLCAATAGDSATVKAIYLASEIRKLDSLRPIGGPEHLKLLQGSDGGERQFNFINGSALDNALDELTDTAMKEPCSFEEREYGRDTRVLSGLLYAYALAMDPGGLGNMWSGKENRGYLCANSLRLINKRRVPEYVDTSIPGMSGTETGLSSLNWEWADDHTDGRLSKKEERNLTRKIKEYDHAGNRIDELDPMFFRMHMNDDDEKEKRSQRNDLKPSNSPVNAQPDLPIDGFGKTVRSGPIFNNLKEINRFQQPVDDSVDDSYDNAVQEFEYDIADVPDLDSTDFDSFYKKLTDEFVADGEENSLDEESARELFDLIKVHQAEEKSQLSTDEDEGEAFVEGTMRGIEEKTSGFGAVEKGPEILAMNSVEKSGDFDSRADRMLHELSILKENMVNLVNPVESTSFSSISSKSGDELALLLEGFPAHRVKKVREVFSSSLGSPSILSLVPAVREIMPERITNSWLKRKNVVDAYAAMESANDNEAVDIHILNSMLQVLSKSGSIDKTLLFYEKEFHARNLVRYLNVFFTNLCRSCS
jgi:pentatricopeptide repeat protein